MVLGTSIAAQDAATNALPAANMQSVPFPSSRDSPATPTLSDSTSASSSSHGDHSDESHFAGWQAHCTPGATPSAPSSATARLPPFRRSSSTNKATDDARHCTEAAAAATPRSKLARSNSNRSRSRPSSIASNSSAGEGSYSGRFPLSPSILSPSLATALGIAVENRKHTVSLYGSAVGNASSASLHSAGYASSSPSTSACTRPYQKPSRRSTGAASASGSNVSSAVSARRPSLPDAPTISQHRVSTVSVSSFESLPEHEAVPNFASSPMLASQPVSRQSSTRSHSGDRRPESPQLAPSLMLPPSTVPHHREDPEDASGSAHLSSPPCSPKTPSAGAPPSAARHTHSSAKPSSTSLNRPSRLQRAQTEPLEGSSMATAEQRNRKRGLIAKELWTTEQAYVECLQVIKDCFYQPLLSRCGGLKGSPNPGNGPVILSRKALTDIFSNFVDIFQLNTELLAQLNERLSPPQAANGSDQHGSRRDRGHDGMTALSPANNHPRCWDPACDTLGDILVPISPFLKMYSLFVKNFSSALTRIEAERRENDNFARFLKDTEKSTWGRGKGFFGLGLQAHLLSIVQRIPRYKLLVGDLLKHTPQGHRDHHDLQKAYSMIEQVASAINENVRQHEMVMLTLAIQRSLLGAPTLVVPGRSLVKRGTLMKACRKDIQARAFFLFTDCIVYARPTSGGGPASIEAAWAVIARAGGISASGHLSKFSSQPFAFGRRESFEQPASIPPEALQPRLRVSSGNLFSANAILDVLQAQQAPQLQYRETIALQDCTVVSIEDNANSHSVAGAIEAGGTPFAFEIRTPDKSFAVYADSAESREAWLDAIREARNEWLQGRRTLQAEEDSIVARRDRRRSVAAAAAAAAAVKGRQSVYSVHPQTANVPESDGTLEGLSPADVTVGGDSGPSTRPMSLSSIPASTSFAAYLSTGASGSNEPLRVLDDYNAPAWVPDSRADRCMACSEAFGVFRRKHHCRLCGRVVCWSCSTQKFIIASYDEEKQDVVARACDSCYESTFPPMTPEEEGEAGPANESLVEDVQRRGSQDPSHRPHAVRFQSRESSVEENEPETPSDGHGLHRAEGEEEARSTADSLATINAPKAHEPHFESLTAPLKALALESGPLSAPLQLDASRFDEHEDRLHARLPSRFPSSIGGNNLGGPRGPARAAIARMSTTSSLAPHVHAATSGSGTFRLAPPRVTTPEYENAPMTRLFEGQGQRSSKGMMGAEGSYFAGAVIPEDGEAVPVEQATGQPARDGEGPTTPLILTNGHASPPRQRVQGARHSLGGGAPLVPSSSSSGSSSPRGPVDPSLARHRSRKKPMSAAARLSTYYGSSIGGGLTSLTSTNGASGAPAQPHSAVKD